MKLSSLKTNGFAITRARLGLSQQQLAEQLGVAKATIGMAETGRRNLPVRALLLLAQLEIKMAAVHISEIPATPIEMDKETLVLTRRNIDIRAMQCEMQVQKLSRTLATMILQHTKYTKQVHLLEGMIQKESVNRPTLFFLSMHLQRERICRQLGKCSIINQTLLRNKIALLGADSHLNKSVSQLLS